MKQVYQKMELEHKIGPVGADGNLRPYAEYPKKVRRSDGRKITCKDQTEEVAVKMWAGEGVKVDPVARERDELAQKLAEAQERLARYERGVPEAGQHPDGTPKDPAKAKSEAGPSPAGEPTAAELGAEVRRAGVAAPLVPKAGTDKTPAPSGQASAVQGSVLDKLPQASAQQRTVTGAATPASPLAGLPKSSA